MTFLDLTTLQIVFLIAAPIVVIALAVFFIVLPVNKSRERKHFREYCYKAIYKIAFDEDYYLINDMVFSKYIIILSRCTEVPTVDLTVRTLIDTTFRKNRIRL